ncbi:hypothetical protein DEJ28_00925 [Curtobacterium sp. MCPF17_002]|uniref:hypothetical protein n=1 Tax=Curtobacterium sp. MCPF17_002 TaxID=2175645 RepID=UPI000DA7DCCD|nr:hypothetical protein [Curtobacterium sp. MCPF17_002]WIB77686.1 hypothetical protein DEJ28_00925 [Curtobacterium sp. MCPF17_002]
MTLHVWGSLPVWCILVVLVARLWLVRTQSASVTWLMVCCAFVAVGLTINQADILAFLAGVTHEPNVADLLGRCLMVCGLFALAQSVEAAARSANLLRPSRLIGCVAVLVALVVLFSFIDAPTPTSSFMAEYGDQLPTALYSAVEMTYIAVVIGRSAVAVVRGFRTSDALGRMYWLFVVGAAAMVLLAVIAIALDAVHVFGVTGAVGVLSAVYAPVFLTSMVLLALGAAGGVLPDAAREFRDWRRTRRRFRALEPELRRLETQSGNHGLYFTIVWQRRQWRTRLHRLSVEIEDRAREAGQDVPAAAAAITGRTRETT